MSFIQRTITTKLSSLATQFPVVALIGPRQSGKTTLAKNTFPNYTYVTLENFDAQHLALSDPRLFFKTYDTKDGIIIDEIQNVPTLLSFMQGLVDEQYRPGHFIITGSQHILLQEKVSQTLAGRIALLTLLPLSIDELTESNQLPPALEELLIKGMYPRVYTEPVLVEDWYANYLATYVQRDVRQMLKIGDLSIFQRFLKLCAQRIGQQLNYSSLAGDCGISPNTARAWISVLEASFIIFLVQPYYKNLNKRLVKTPKLYFYDSGLACSLLNILEPQKLFTHDLRGALFESFVMAGLTKMRLNQGKQPDLYFVRDIQGYEIDCVWEKQDLLIPIEIKSSTTAKQSFFDQFTKWDAFSGQHNAPRFIVYAGDLDQQWPEALALSWRRLKKIMADS